MKPMTPDTDPGLLREALQYLWAALLIPLKMLWSKADNAASKEDLAAAIRASEERAKEWREVARTLFNNAEKDRKDAADSRERIQQKLYDLHVDILEKRK